MLARRICFRNNERMQILTPAQVVVQEFGSLRAVATAAGIEHTTVRLWLRERSNGDTGLVPSSHHRKLLGAARERGLRLTETDLIWGRSC